MIKVLIQALSFVGIIFMGFLLKRIGFFEERDFKVLSKIVIRITLTCAIITNFNGKILDLSLFVMSAISLIFGLTLMLLAYLFNSSKDDKAFAIINATGVNIGNFVLPFAQSFLSSNSIVALCLFDAANGIFCLGGTYSVAQAIRNDNTKISRINLLKPLTKSVPFMTYVIMVTLCLLHITLPSIVINFATIAANANAFLAMLMIGVGFKLNINKSQLSAIFKILSIRYITAFIFTFICWFTLPIPLYCKQALVLLLLGPIASACPGFTNEAELDYELSCSVNSFSILISIFLIVISLVIVI